MTRSTTNAVDAYCEAWAASLALLLSQMSTARWQVEPAPKAREYVPLFRLRVTMASMLTGQMWLSFSEADLTGLLKVGRAESNEAAKSNQSQREAILDLVEQWAVCASSTLEANFGKLSFEVSLDDVNAEGGSTRLLAANDGSTSIVFRLEIDEGLAAALDQRPAKTVTTSAEASSARIDELVRQGNLGLLMDVELGVMLQFGCRQATLREVLELATGAVLELDREIQEPVELLLNGRVIARGDVVVIDGNYGLRVTEVASAQQRVSSL